MKTVPRVDVLHGVNLRLLGAREPQHYGARSLAAIDKELIRLGRELGLAVRCRQTDVEARFVAWLGAANREARAVICNPGAWTHTSVAIRDAVAALAIPAIEVHVTNIYARESFRRHSFLAPAVHGIIVGFGTVGYALALRGVANLIQGAR
ncbi:MAG: 3-dehydroquinate dehydratase [Deltaproteobacteria bacterium]|nr:3-dehydroquinate dehydratase [Deltaproteobacteria bacterium]